MVPPPMACGLALLMLSLKPTPLSYTTPPMALFQILMRNLSTPPPPVTWPSVAVRINP